MTGREKMAIVVANAVPDIRQRLWTLYELVVNQDGLVIVELGVRSGDSTRAILCGMQDCKTYCNVISYDIDGDAYRVGEVTAKMGLPWEDWEKRWLCYKDDSAKAAELWQFEPKEKFSLVFVDTDHSLETTRREIAAWAPLVRVGGCMAFHDTELNEPGRDGVRPACEEWANAHTNWQWEMYPHLGDGDTGFGVLWRRS